MKNKLKTAGFMVCLIAGFCFWTNQQNDLPVLMLENIEALAYGEGMDRAVCYGDGSIDCHGDWVEIIIIGTRLK